MKSTVLARITGAALFAVLAMPAQIMAQGEQEHRAERFPHYRITDLGTLGGPYSFSYNLNDAGVVSGGSATGAQNGDPSQAVVNAPQTAFFWDHGRLRKLGTLGGPDSAGAATNLSKLAAVDSETKNLSRQGEDVCAFGTHLQCLAATWKNGRLAPLSLLPGGNNSYALDMNDRGQIVGFSDTDVYDLGCAAATTAGFQFQAVIWEPDGRVRQPPLAPLGRDTVANAFGINNKGQVVGDSGVCANTTPPPYPSSPHAVLWERDGTPIDLGSLGGPVSGASAINDRGDVSGTSTTADGSPRPFLWTPESRTLLQLEPPDGFPIAINPCCKTINDRREIVGFMLDSNFNSHAFLWKNGAMVDLNNLIAKDSPWMLQSAAGINASGEIAGQGLIHGEVHAFLATPCQRHGDRECCEAHDR
jgi:probable HAF family extracellular repeat protein